MIKGDNEFEQRNEKLEHVTEVGWWWPKEDFGAWDGPIKDWNQTHHTKYFDHVDKRRVVVTAGGNMGLHTRAYSEMFERVYVFEPDKTNFHGLVRNNYAENVFFFKAALGKTAGWCDLKHNGFQNMGMHQVEKNDKGIVPIMSIDSLRLNACDLIQLDVEGCEYDALVGAENTIKEFSPVVITEGNHGNVRKFLAALDYITDTNSAADFIWRIKGEG